MTYSEAQNNIDIFHDFSIPPDYWDSVDIKAFWAIIILFILHTLIKRNPYRTLIGLTSFTLFFVISMYLCAFISCGSLTITEENNSHIFIVTSIVHIFLVILINIGICFLFGWDFSAFFKGVILNLPMYFTANALFYFESSIEAAAEGQNYHITFSLFSMAALSAFLITCTQQYFR